MKKHKDNLMLPRWANLMIRFKLRYLLIAFMVFMLPMYFVLYSDSCFEVFERDLEQVRRT